MIPPYTTLAVTQASLDKQGEQDSIHLPQHLKTNKCVDHRTMEGNLHIYAYTTKLVIYRGRDIKVEDYPMRVARALHKILHYGVCGDLRSMNWNGYVDIVPYCY